MYPSLDSVSLGWSRPSRLAALVAAAHWNTSGFDLFILRQGLK